MSLCCLFMSVAPTFVTISASYKKFEAGFTRQAHHSVREGESPGRSARTRSSRRVKLPRTRPGDCYVRAGRPCFRLGSSARPRVGELQRTLRLRVLGRPTSRGVGARDCRADVVQPQWRPTRRRDANVVHVDGRRVLQSRRRRRSSGRPRTDRLHGNERLGSSAGLRRPPRARHHFLPWAL